PYVLVVVLAVTGPFLLVLGFGLVQWLFASEQVGNEHAVAGIGPLPADALDLLVHAPPFLDDDDAGRRGRRIRLCMPGGRGLAIGAGYFDLLCHVLSLVAVVCSHRNAADGTCKQPSGWGCHPLCLKRRSARRC